MSLRSEDSMQAMPFMSDEAARDVEWVRWQPTDHGPSSWRPVSPMHHPPTTERERSDAFPERVAAAGAADALCAPTGSIYRLALLILAFLGPPALFAAAAAEPPHASFCRLLLWAAACELCGFGTMDGPLGNGRGISLWAPLRFRLTAGTLRQPTLEGRWAPGPTRTVQPVQA